MGAAARCGIGVGSLLVTLLAVLLALALVAVTFNTIRLQILTRRDEIEVSKLIGATNPFIRRPFLYFGALQGLPVVRCLGDRGLGGLGSECSACRPGRALWHGIQAAAPGCHRLNVLLVFSAALGWLGAWLSVSRHLWQIEPQ